MNPFIDDLNALDELAKKTLDGRVEESKSKVVTGIYTEKNNLYGHIIKLQALAYKYGGVPDKNIMKQLLSPGEFKTARELEDRTPNRGKK